MKDSNYIVAYFMTWKTSQKSHFPERIDLGGCNVHRWQ